MFLFQIDRNKCKRDGICQEVCPTGIIMLNESTGMPEPIEGAEEFCLHCGHCVAVCPQGAISHRSMIPDECPPLQKELISDPYHVENLLKARRSIRTYKPDKVHPGLIEKLIHIARYAPSGHNIQPVRWLVIHDTEKVKRLSSITTDWMRMLIKDKHPLLNFKLC